MKTLLPVAILLACSTLSGCVLLRDSGPTLRILDQGAFGQFDSIKGPFENQTGVKLVRLEGGDAGTALKTALLGAGNPPADILFGVDNVLFSTPEIREKSLFVPYESPNLYRIDEDLISVDIFRVNGELWATPVEHGYISVNYDIRLRNSTPTQELPTTLRDLATARWAPRFVTEDPSKSSPGLGFFLATIATFPDGSAYDWKHYWRDLLQNGTKVVHDWTTAYVYHYSGGYGSYDSNNAADRNITVSYTTSPAYEVIFGTPSVPGVSFEPAKGVFHQVETMGILRGTKNLEHAKKFIDYMLTDDFQQYNAPSNAVYPVTRGTELPALLTELSTDPRDLRPAQISKGQLDAKLETWINDWVALYQAETA